MNRKCIMLLGVVLIAMAVLPSVAAATLTNEYGMTFAGTATCTGCHDTLTPGKDATVHGRFMKSGLVPSAPAGWTAFRAAGDPPVVAGTAPALFNSGGSYAIAQPWLTFGDFAGGAATEYAFWHTSTDPNVLPWNLVEGLTAEPSGAWNVGADAPDTGLYDVQYGCQRCHTLGATVPKASATDPAVIPNPAATIAVTATTARQWARDSSKTVANFMADPTVSYPGMSIGCEKCHGTGVKDAAGHMGTGVDVSTSLATMGDSQVCGQCHGSYTNVAGTLGIYGYTPNLPMRNFVDINGLSGGYSYTQVPTVDEFLANPTKYFLFPNGDNAKGSHYYYNEWSTTAHSYRGALTATSPDALQFQADGHGHYNATTSGLDCAKCHTGEGYLKSKDAPIAASFTPDNTNTGFMGQECVTCHNAHPSGVGASDVIRTPDPAGVRSATGLAVGNSSICEDCHNWQYEVQGTTPVVQPLAAITDRGGPSHPQRESLAGRVMLEVPVAGQFMPGAKCEDCHMPKTNKAANRYAHGMKIMMPGDAEAWNAAAGAGYNGEDSCSSCHAGATRTELQGDIDTWQADTTAAADAAAAAITDAQTRAPAEYSLTDATKPGYILVGKATWNYKAFGADGSTGAHNPEYMQAALAKAEQMAKSVGGSFANLLASASILPGGTGNVSGKVVNGDGSAAAGASLKLLAGGVATGDTTVADGHGNFAFLVAPAAGTVYSVVWVRSSDPITDLTSSTITMAVAKQPWKITFKLSKAKVAVRKSVRFSGSVLTNTGGIATGSVIIQKKKASGGSWATFKTLALDAGGLYSVNVKMTKRGTWVYRAKMAEDATHPITYSAIRKLKVY